MDCDNNLMPQFTSDYQIGETFCVDEQQRNM